MRRIEKQMRAHPQLRLGHGSKGTAYVHVDTLYYIYRCMLFLYVRQNYVNLYVFNALMFTN